MLQITGYRTGWHLSNVKGKSSKNMLLFIVAEPKRGSENHGVVQRVRAIDTRFAHLPRKLVFISLRRNWRAVRIATSETLSEEHLNAFLHAPSLFWYGVKAKFIYIHTCTAAIRSFILLLFSNKLIVDVHGLLPEELLMMRKKAPGSPWHLVARCIEKICVMRSAALVVVTDAMGGHFRAKYPGLKSALFSVPIFAEFPAPVGRFERDSRMAVYSGGIQEWQCIDETLDLAISVRHKISCIFLTGEPIALRERAANKGLNEVRIKTANKNELALIYAQATYGFVLRKSSPVNFVACPTKLVEYLESGLIPIVHETKIGDFDAAGYRYITDIDFRDGRLPDAATLDIMRQANFAIIGNLKQRSQKGLEDLACMFCVDIMDSRIKGEQARI